ncbi:hypothetical protein ACQ858_17085 [Variovorax ureilyticus]|uniref:hypothetical protein n=1 Tax=Variovorax ureilyticus TaxID=1836198 RepID=UPI003D67A3E6
MTKSISSTGTTQVHPEILGRHAAPSAQGLAGKDLIHELWPDDFDAPPLRLDLSGTAPSGQAVYISIPYR